MGCFTVGNKRPFSFIPDILCSAPPPTDSKPEAHNFPSQIYEFNQNTSLFRAPKYPEAPKDMYYQVPSKPSRVDRAKSIFPWEEHAPRPTRVFPEERPPSPEPEPEVEKEPEPVPTARTSSDASESSETTRQSRSSSNSASETDPWNSYTRANAWDAMPEIERYAQAFAQVRRGKVQVIHQSAPPSGTTDQSSLSPPTDTGRGPSMKLTDFPTEVERPSLPVTPAPRHPSFWGEETDNAGELPTAEGVPKQQDWVSRVPSHPESKLASTASAASAASAASDYPCPPSRILYWRCQYCGKQNPVQKLEELQRRQSEVLQTGPELKPKELPRRDMPGSGVDPTAVAEATAKATSPGKTTPTDSSTRVPDSGVDTAAMAAPPAVKSQPPTRLKPILKEPSFELGGSRSGEGSPASKDVVSEVLSPDITTSA